MFGIAKMWLLPVMVLVMMSAVIDARLCKVDVGRRAAKGPEAYTVNKW